MVRRVTRSWATHAEFIDTTAGTAFGAYLSGVRTRPIDYAKFEREERFTAPNIAEAYAWAQTQSGKRYDYSAIFGIFLDREWRDDTRWFCSELVAAAFEKTNTPLLNPNAETWRITPRDLLLSMWLARVVRL